VSVLPGRPRRRNRVVATVTAGMLLASSTAALASPRFDDVDHDRSPHGDAISELAERGIIEGRTATTFAPARTLTRAQLASVVARAAELPSTSERPFDDVTDGPHADNIAAAEAAGLMQGFGDGTFRPDQPTRRAHIAAVLQRWVEAPAGDTDVFTDLDRTVHAEAIAALAGIDVARGTTETTFSPAAALRRDQAASFVWRALTWLESRGGGTVDLTVLGTSDIHAHLLDWDYYNDRPFSAGLGLSRVATLVEEIRDERGTDTTLLIDNGDIIQGNPLGSYFANVEPATDPEAGTHPVAAAMNALEYDAMVVGNHEFNYGLELLDTFEGSLDFPLLGANVTEDTTGDPAFAPYTVVTVEPDGHEPIEVGFLGLTTPGSAIWDRTHVEDRVTFEDGVATAAEYVPMLREQEGADVVVVIAHAGIDGDSSYGDALDLDENFVRELAEEVPGIDAVLTGHTHRDIPEERVTNTTTGQEVILTQPSSWGRALSVIDLQLEATDDGWTLVDAGSTTRSTAEVTESSLITDLVADAHAKVVDYVNATVGESLEELRMEHANLEDVAALDFVNHVQAEALEAELAVQGVDDVEVLSVAAPFNLGAVMPEGPVSIRDIAGMYIYDNTLVAVGMTGAELEDYLEWSAEYFEGVDDAGPFARSEIGTTKPSYNFDVVYGVEYDIDLTQPVGERIVDLTFDGAPIDPEQRFAVAMNNYRVNGGGGAPHVTDAPIVWDSLLENRSLLIEWVQAEGVVDPADFHTVDWRLTADGTPIEFTD
jgi:2',3'-cyclic-nucleotide 2'-phosphodiesterase / 3'-nucleotidase